MIPLYTSSLKFKEVFTLPKEDYTSKLKDLIRANFSKEHIVFTADGRNATYLTLKSIGMKEDDEILVPGYACQPVRVAIEPVCKPVYVDVDEQTLNINPQKVERHITKKTRAILVIHLYGNPCDMNEISKIARAHNLIVIEDTVQAFGGKYDGQMLGSFGDFTIFSFGSAKDVGCYKGGALLSKKEIKAELKPPSLLWIFPKLAMNMFALNQINKIPAVVYSPLVVHWLTPSLERDARSFKLSNETLSNYQCYLLYQQFTRMWSVIEKRRQNAAYYSQRLRDIVTIPKETEGGEHTFYRYVIQVDNRNELYRYLLRHGIGANIVDSLLDAKDTCPNSVMANERHLMIPVHSGLMLNDMEKVVKTIYAFVSAS